MLDEAGTTKDDLSDNEVDLDEESADLNEAPK